MRAAVRRFTLRAAAAAVAAAALGAGASRFAGAEGPGDSRNPYVGYVYPAGGQRGTVFQVLAGGQNLQGVSSATVSGDGVRAAVVRHVRPLNNQQQGELRRRVAEVREKRRIEAMTPLERERMEERQKERERQAEKDAKKAGAKGEAVKKVEEDRPKLPDHPLLNDLDALSDRALEEVLARFVGMRSRQQTNVQIAETVEVEVEIAPGTPPGVRELRFHTPIGITNPVRFEVGGLPEAREEEAAGRTARDLPAVDVPALLNGQILPGDVDRFRFRARRGQRLLIQAHARELVPWLADAVPGWFQAVLSVQDGRGRELAYSDDSAFEPDPRLAFDVPTDGEYLIEIRDALYRGREDFVYRVMVAEDPTLSVTPSAGDAPRPPAKTVPAVPRAVDAVPSCDEAEANDDAAHAQRIELPRVVRGRISRPGDVDVYAFRGLAGDDVVAEVEGRRIRSPIDSGLRLVGPDGAVVAWNDDFEDGEPGTITHHADSYLRTKLPADGLYTVEVRDVTAHGSTEHDYVLRVGPPLPDFELVVTPASLTAPGGRVVPFRVHAVRRDGWQGEIAVSLKDAPPGFAIAGATIPAGRSSARLTLTSPRGIPDGAVALRFEGRARIGDRDVVRPAIPAEDRMQAFAYRHLTPTQEMLVAVTGQRRNAPPIEIPTPLPVRVPLGGTARVEFRVPGLPGSAEFSPELDEPPPGLTIAGFEILPGVVAVLLKADATAAKAGPTENLILEVAANANERTANAKLNGGRRFTLGYLPAVPCEIVKP